MRKIAFALSLFMLLGLAEQAYTQESVTETTKFAKRCLENMKKRRFKKLASNYPQAVKDIENIRGNVSDKRFGYDKVAKNAPSWIAMMNALNKFPGQQAILKDETISFEIVDYTADLAEARTIACKDHYDEGVEIMDKYSTNYIPRKRAFTHFNQSIEYGDTYKETIYDYAATIHYDEGLRLYNNGSSFSSKAKAEEPFKKALKWINPYKDINELMAKLYFDEAERLANIVTDPEGIRKEMKEKSSKSSELAKIMSEIKKYYTAAGKYIADYEGCNAKYKPLKAAAAEALYEAAEYHETQNSYTHQKYAMNLYNETSKYVKNYQDAADRAAQAEKNSTVYVIGVDQHGRIMNPALLSNLDKQLMAHFVFYSDPNGTFSSLDLNDESNYTQVYEQLGKGFIIIRKGLTSESYDYKITGPTSSTENITKYVVVNNETGETKVVDKTAYNTTKTAQKLTNTDVFSFYKYTGTVTTETTSATATGEFTAEVWDYRNMDYPTLIATTSKTNSRTDAIKRQTYNGHPSAKPSLVYDSRDLKNKEFLTNSIPVPLVNARIYDNESKISKVLNVLEYKVQ